MVSDTTILFIWVIACGMAYQTGLIGINALVKQA